MDYYDGGTARNIAIAGANMAANKLFINPPLIAGNPWWGGYLTPVKFGNGYFVVTVDSTSSVDPFSGDRRLTMRSRGTYRDSTFTVMAIMSQSKFSKFAFYAGVSAANAWWETGDSVFGPAHTQGTMRVTGRPYFGGKVTTKNGVDSSWAGHPHFTAGVETGVSIPLNLDYSRLVNAAQNNGKTFTNNQDVTLKFQGDSVKWHVGTNPDTTTALGDFAPNGAIVHAGRGNLYVEGVIKGRVTIGSVNTQAGAGRIVFTGNTVYATDPRVDPSTHDMFGAVAYRDVNIADNGASVFTVNGSLMSATMGVTVEHYNSRNPGYMYTLGGWIGENVYPTSNGIAAGVVGTKGLKANIRYDERLRTQAPPYFPSTNGYEILAWYE
jgi:cytoskeletal protein CcmA (bactofilin family)